MYLAVRRENARTSAFRTSRGEASDRHKDTRCPGEHGASVGSCHHAARLGQLSDTSQEEPATSTQPAAP